MIAAAILYLPSNLFPVMTISTLVHSQQFTIMTGIFELFQRGLWPLGILVFFASILIPITKLLTLGYMLVLTQVQSEEHLLGPHRGVPRGGFRRPLVDDRCVRDLDSGGAGAVRQILPCAGRFRGHLFRRRRGADHGRGDFLRPQADVGPAPPSTMPG